MPHCEETALKIPACLIKSRHGVYSCRYQFVIDTKRKERRFSLFTKCPRTAKAKAIQISAIIAQYKHSAIAIRNINTQDDINGAMHLNLSEYVDYQFKEFTMAKNTGED